ncbi:unnamed protein product [Fusarium venenatum]|uniref:Uncharacterized protein n=1 Tax=Fusarium venenatum TaxID=56646 RepID=A0A2L2TMW0_9HYPO|nr:uncharacterized protein FVRRES_01148 [Fusarium venenatum]CEI64636.1 unnamed protein product [Fusarium venenatum]
MRLVLSDRCRKYDISFPFSTVSVRVNGLSRSS